MTAPLRGLTRRRLRLGSGSLLFAYIALHLANHALGLVSLAQAERALDVAARFWHSLVGSALLYGAFTVHLALAFDAIHAHRTLRMAPADLVRIFLGLGIPTLLIGHAVGTRLAWQLYGDSTAYTRVIGALLATDGQGRQLALLVPGWLHGCIGLHFAFARRPLYQRLQPALFALALLLPVLSALGMLSMARELQTSSAWRGAVAATGEHSLGGVRRAVLAVYFGACALVFLSRWARGWRERRAGSTVTIRYPHRAVRVPRGWSVLEASRSHHLPHLSVCGGRARCSTCRVRIVDGEASCPPPSGMERATLKRIHAAPDVRLACQLRPCGDVALVPMLGVPHTSRQQAPAANAVESALAVVRVDWRDFQVQSHVLLPQDELFLATRLRRAMQGVAMERGAVICNTGPGSVTFAFGIWSPQPAACRDALRAMRAVEEELDAIADLCARQFGLRPRFGLCAHAGMVALGEAEDGRHPQRDAAGPAIRELQELQRAGAEQGARIVLSRELLVLAQAVDLAGPDGSARGLEGTHHPAAVAFASLRATGLPAFAQDAVARHDRDAAPLASRDPTQ